MDISFCNNRHLVYLERTTNAANRSMSLRGGQL